MVITTATLLFKIMVQWCKCFENISKVLEKNSRAVIGLSNKDMISLGEKYFSLVDKHEFRAHRSLTRYFAVYQN